MSSAAAGSVRAVLFDFGLVLSETQNAAAWERMRAVTGLAEEPLHAGYWAYRHDYDRGALTGPNYWRAVAGHAGIAIDAAEVAELIDADTAMWTDLNVPMVEWAMRLQRAGMRTGILSNIGDSIAEGLRAKLPWLGGFYHCTWSYELKMAKPEPAIYLETAARLETPLAEILFIDDRAENVAGAVLTGMQAIQYTSYPAFLSEMRERGLGWLLDAVPAAVSDDAAR